MEWVALASAVLGGARGSPAMPTNATAAGSNQGGGGLDASGWNVTFGNNSGVEAARSETTQMTQTMKYVLILVGGVLVWRYLKKA